jgi:hypothetical protein
MDIRTAQLCMVGRQLKRTHGVFFAAAFLCENGVSLEEALQVLLSVRYAQE